MFLAENGSVLSNMAQQSENDITSIEEEAEASCDGHSSFAEQDNSRLL